MTPAKRLGIGTLSVAMVLGLSSWASGWFIPTETTVTELSPGVFFRKTQTKPEFIGCKPVSYTHLTLQKILLV